MKFCPQCGTPFEPEARFCAECGFDGLSVESASPLPPSAPEVIVTSTETNTTDPQNYTQPETIISCPRCNTTLSLGDRFCLECGFDTSGIKNIVVDVPQTFPEPAVEEISIEENTIEETISTPANKQLCPQCGSGIEVNERFCLNCGFDTSASKDAADEIQQAIQPSIIEEPNIEGAAIEETVSVQHDKLFCPHCGSGFEPGERFCQECGFDSMSDKITTNIKHEPEIIPPVPEVLPAQKPVKTPPVTVTEISVAQLTNQTGIPHQHTIPQKRNNKMMRIVLIIIGIAVLGTAGWYGYTKYSSTSKDTPVEANAKPLSLMDQELAKHKAKEQNQVTQQNTTIQEADESAVVAKKVIPSKVILEVGRSEEPKNQNPKNPTKLTLSKATMITRITTDHYNNGMGTPGAGNILIKDRFGITLGNYKAFGKKGINDTPSAKWVAEPNIILAKGTYIISDSDIETWSRTFLGSSGFVVVEGYEVK